MYFIINLDKFRVDFADSKIEDNHLQDKKRIII